LFAVTLGSEIAAKSVQSLLFTLVIIGNSRSRRSACSAVHRQLSDTCLANFSDYGVTTKLRESYELV